MLIGLAGSGTAPQTHQGPGSKVDARFRSKRVCNDGHESKWWIVATDVSAWLSNRNNRHLPA